MKLTKLRLTKDVSNKLKNMAARTGVTPNLLCRMGFCMSLEEPTIPNPEDYPEEDREFNRYTLLGEYDPLFVALLRQRCHQDAVADSQHVEYFRAHLNRGILLLQKRVRSIGDIADFSSTGGKF